MTENVMSEEQYNELLKAYTKEALASMIKADIRNRFPEPYASMYCQQFDDFQKCCRFLGICSKVNEKIITCLTCLCFPLIHIKYVLRLGIKSIVSRRSHPAKYGVDL